jgi:hypothetical protein
MALGVTLDLKVCERLGEMVQIMEYTVYMTFKWS